MKTLIAGLVALVTVAWGWDAVTAAEAAGGVGPWLVRQQALYLTGYLSIALMSLAMLLAARPLWLEGPLGGLDRMYRGHKWAGILAVAFAALHWLVEMSDDLLKSLVGREGQLPKETFAGFLEVLRDLAQDMGEWAIYAALAMVALTLWKRLPYRPWRLLHQATPVIYLMLAFHAALLAPAADWSRPSGWLLALLLGAGAHGSLRSLAGWIGRGRKVGGTIVEVERTAHDVVAVRCRLDAGWRGHRPGQFAFVSFDDKEGAHPFTIAGADRGDRTVAFQIKALGDYTRGLAERLQPGQAVTVEGPYGRFDMARRDREAQQIWVAGGIGVTPFIAWLESLQGDPQRAPRADLHYCTRDRADDPFVARLEFLCRGLPGVRLQVHGARQGEVLDAVQLAQSRDRTRPAEVWFCGPRGLADKLRTSVSGLWRGRVSFHQEAFEMR